MEDSPGRKPSRSTRSIRKDLVYWSYSEIGRAIRFMWSGEFRRERRDQPSRYGLPARSGKVD
ncbi:MAG: hypothetical protein MZV64_73720 [Ignavibacteriales bacterium]|nr:hypothetical protein [Ignavibacteriales bacterium]